MSTKSSSAVAAELRAAAARRDLTAVQIAEKLGVERHWVSRRLRGTQALGVDDVARICEAIEVRPGDIYAAAHTTPEAVNQ